MSWIFKISPLIVEESHKGGNSAQQPPELHVLTLPPSLTLSTKSVFNLNIHQLSLGFDHKFFKVKTLSFTGIACRQLHRGSWPTMLGLAKEVSEHFWWDKMDYNILPMPISTRQHNAKSSDLFATPRKGNSVP